MARATFIPSCQVLPLFPQGKRAFSHRHRRNIYRTLSARASCTSREAGEEQGKEQGWRNEVKMLFDADLPLNAKQFVFQDLLKQGPTIAKEIIGDVFSRAGVPGVPALLEQIEKDILPDVLQNGREYIQTAVETAPEAVNTFASSAMEGPKTPPSLQDIQHEIRNTISGTSEGYETPEFDVLTSNDDYEIRRYSGYLIAETALSRVSRDGARELQSAKASGKGFTTLASYLFGKNQRNEAMSMTVPVRTENRGDEAKMSFVIPRKYSSVDEVPVPNGAEVTLRKVESYVVAVSKFSGFATEGEIDRQREKLLSCLKRDLVMIGNDGENSYTVLQYSGPYVLPNVRRNELCIPVQYSTDVSSVAGGEQESTSIPDLDANMYN